MTPTLHCENCAQMETRISELKAEIIEIEDRRSRERVRFVQEAQKQFFRTISPEDEEYVPKQDLIDLLDLMKRIVQDPRGETLEFVKSKLEKFYI